MNSCENRIRVEAAALGRLVANPRHIEAWMRLKCPALEGLTPEEFLTELAIAIRCAEIAGDDASDALARCFGVPARPS